jgi:3'-phosphoadenosine 5'-phosphosulfate sulfotransferase (PAPS reductase)/FAD synthetase
MKILVPFSGGKDSQATLIWACERYGVKNITAVFCDTKWEHEFNYQHIKYIVNKLGVEFVNLVSKKYDGFIGLAKERGMSSSGRRICTIELKVVPMIDYVLSLKEHCLIIQGIRADESASRALMKDECTFFKYYFQPYKTNSTVKDQLETVLSEKGFLSYAQKTKLAKVMDRLKLGKEDPKFHTYRKKDVFAFNNNYSHDIIRPFFFSSAMDVIRFSLNRGFAINPLYFLGYSRVGCFTCIMATKNEMHLIITTDQETVDKILNLEYLVGKTFF